MSQSLYALYANSVSYVAYADAVFGYSDVGTDSVRTDCIAALGEPMGGASCDRLGIDHTFMGGGIRLFGDDDNGCGSGSPDFTTNDWLDDDALGRGVNSCNDCSCARTHVGPAGQPEGRAAFDTQLKPWLVFGRSCVGSLRGSLGAHFRRSRRSALNRDRRTRTRGRSPRRSRDGATIRRDWRLRMRSGRLRMRSRRLQIQFSRI